MADFTAEEIAAVTSLHLGNLYNTNDSEKIKDLTGIEHFTSLKYLDCSYNLLTSLDVVKLTLLETMICGNNSITNLDVSNNTLLQELDCDGNNLVALDITNNDIPSGSYVVMTIVVLLLTAPQ